VVPSPDAGDFLAITIRTERCEQTAAKNSELLKIPIASAAQIQLSPQAPGVGHGRPLGHIGKSPTRMRRNGRRTWKAALPHGPARKLGSLLPGLRLRGGSAFQTGATIVTLYSNIGIQLSILVNQG